MTILRHRAIIGPLWRSLRPYRVLNQLLLRHSSIPASFQIVRRQHNKSNDPLGLQEFLNDLNEKETQEQQSEKQKQQSESVTIPEMNEDDFLNSLNVQEPSQDDFAHSEQPIETKSEADDQIDSFLESLNLNEESTNSNFELGSDNSSADNISNVVAQEQALFEDIFKSLNTNAANDTGLNYEQIYKNLTKYRMTKNQNEMADQEERLEEVKDALKSSLQYIENIDHQSTLIQEVNKLLQTTSELLQDSETYNEVFLSQLSDSQHKHMVDSIKEITTPHNQILNVITLPIIFNQFLKVNNTKFKDGQLTISLFNYLKTHLHLYLVICNQDTYNEILKTIWIFHGKSNLYQIETIITEMLNNGFQGNLLTFHILNQIITDYYSLKMNKHPFINNNLPIWNQEDDERASQLERKLRTISYNVKSGAI